MFTVSATWSQGSGSSEDVVTTTTQFPTYTEAEVYANHLDRTYRKVLVALAIDEEAR